MKTIIGTGFFCTHDNLREKLDFFHIWNANLGASREIVMVDNSEPKPFVGGGITHGVRAIEAGNLGHVGSHIGQYRPHILGWSMSWIIPALIAYTEEKDFIYFEQDCLAFGSWEEAILREMDEKNLQMAFGEGSKWACCEQSLFYIKREFITEAVWMYLSIPEGDGMVLPEDKFRIMSERNMRIGRHSLPCGRNRPLPYDAPVWYSQKFTPEEMAELANRKMI